MKKYVLLIIIILLFSTPVFAELTNEELFNENYSLLFHNKVAVVQDKNSNLKFDLGDSLSIYSWDEDDIYFVRIGNNIVSKDLITNEERAIYVRRLSMNYTYDLEYNHSTNYDYAYEYTSYGVGTMGVVLSDYTNYDVQSMNMSVISINTIVHPDEEYIYISTPSAGTKTINKDIIYGVQYRIKSNQLNDMIFHYNDIFGELFQDNIDVEIIEIKYNDAIKDGDFYRGIFSLRIKYLDNFIGATGLEFKIEETVNKIIYRAVTDIEIVPFTDSNGDGIDDLTGESSSGQPMGELEGKPNRSDYEDGILGTISYTIDLLIYYITTPFRWIAQALTFLTDWLTESMSWITSLSSFFGQIFAFLPSEFVAVLYMMLVSTVIFSLFKLMRG